MTPLRIGIIDLASKGPTRAIWARMMNANLASLMPQAVAVWCREEGHQVTYVCYTGAENLVEELPKNVDVVFIGAFTEAAQLAYALSNQFRSQGAVTVIGGPHARCYPEDAAKYFDFVLGLTDRQIIREVLYDKSPHRPLGRCLSASEQPTNIPGARERWDFIEATLRKAPVFKIIPMLGSVGCPYTCSFCIDSTIPYQSLSVDGIKEDLRFLLTKFRRPVVGWHDPNYGVRFDNMMDAIEESCKPGSIDFIAESSLSLLSETRVKRLQRNGFKVLLPGIESWFELGAKASTGTASGMEKVRRVSDHVNMILRHIPYVQTNFVLGLDSDSGQEPFELTKRFLDLTPGAFPGFSLLSAFGQAAPLNLDYQRAGRVIGFPFHFLNNNSAMNIKPMNYEWAEFYRRIIDLTKYSFSPGMITRRARVAQAWFPRWLNVIRAVSSEGYGRINGYGRILSMLETDRQFRAFFEQRSSEVPGFYVDRIRKDLGSMWQWLPEGAIEHDPQAYLRSVGENADMQGNAELRVA
jgi:hypothetical protein